MSSKIKLAGKEKLQALFDISNTYTSVLVRLNLIGKGYNTQRLKQYIKIFDISLKQFELNKVQIHEKRRKKTLSEILIENFKYDTGHLKKLLYKEGLLKEVCSECGLGPVWNNKPITLQLDHINGINKDNRLENLRILCPNCHTQTETYIKGNKALTKYECLNCKKLSDKKRPTGYCKNCYSKADSYTKRTGIKSMSIEITSD